MTRQVDGWTSKMRRRFWPSGAATETWDAVRLLETAASHVYSSVYAEAEPFSQPQMVPSGVSRSVCQSNVTH